MQARLEALERQQQSQYVPQQAPARPEIPVASPAALTPFQRVLAEQARPTKRGFVREGLPYNYPLRWYARPDGDIVKLQGDPNNRTYYEDKGFHLLTEEEVHVWEAGEREKVVAEQRRKAAIITAFRRLEVRVPAFILDDELSRDFADMSADAILEEYHLACAEANVKPQIRQSRHKAEPRDAQLAGIETGSVDDRLQGLLDGTRTAGPTRGNGRTIEAQPGRSPNFTY